jgi:hypothetical protein
VEIKGNHRMDQLEQDIYNIWSEMHPYIAFQCGSDAAAGKFFVPTEENIKSILDKIDELRVTTLDSVNLGLFNCFETTLKFEEPFHVIYESIWAYFSYVVKEGINEHHLEALTKNIIIALRENYERVNNKTWPIEIRIVTHNNYLGLLGILTSIEKEAKNLKLIFTELREELKKYMKKYSVAGINVGDFSEVFPILESKGGNIGRKEVYPNILRDMYGYLEQPGEIEAMALNWLNEEKPKFNIITQKLGLIFKVEPTVEAVSNKISKNSNIKKKELIEFIENFRKPLKRLVEENIVRITPKYNTKVLETPDYLLNLISTGAMRPFDLHTDDPFNIFFVTTNSKRSPPTNPSELFQLIIHEEFGHCVHFSNSATKFDANITLMDLIYTTLALPISDGISFYRELESLELIRKIIKKPEDQLTGTEQEFLSILKTINDPKLFLLESEFTIYLWRIIRFLRAIGDIRINMHKQSIAEFINWAHEYTGISKKLIFDQIFLFQARPGYAPCYSIVGERIHELQKRAKDHGRNEIDFNTFASSLGFPIRKVFEQKLSEY